MDLRCEWRKSEKLLNKEPSGSKCCGMTHEDECVQLPSAPETFLRSLHEKKDQLYNEKNKALKLKARKYIQIYSTYS